MHPRRLVRISKFLSLVLRHMPETIGIQLDPSGWVPVDAVLAGCRDHGVPLTADELREVVTRNDKRRFALSPDGTQIRASQGHSLPVELGYEPLEPPELLYHGTAEKNLPSIRRHGLLKSRRHHVHLSPDPATATNVGMRYGKPVVLTIHSARMHGDGYAFYCSANGVWLTDHVPPGYLHFPAIAEP
jgi:putative RNA 2'-phosphotransferase